MKVLITGGAGFVGSRLAHLFSEEGASVTVFDNLYRRGSELNIPILAARGVKFVKGDVRFIEQIESLEGTFDIVIDAAAEPSVHAGRDGADTDYLVRTNLVGTVNLLEFARQRGGAFVFLSTSRVYSLEALQSLKLTDNSKRFTLASPSQFHGLSANGISEEFPISLGNSRTLYGTTKLASELLVEEYGANFKIPYVINRCGVIAGAGQFGRTDQGVFTLWVARHLFGGKLSFTGYGGLGYQVRDLLHPRDVFSLLKLQLAQIEELPTRRFVCGGGLSGSVSLLEYTTLTQNATGRQLEVTNQPETSVGDVPFYVTDNSCAERTLGWTPRISPREIVGEIAQWLQAEEQLLKPIFLS